MGMLTLRLRHIRFRKASYYENFPMFGVRKERKMESMVLLKFNLSAATLNFKSQSKTVSRVNMTTQNDLILAIKDTLETDGTLQKFKAEMRTKILDILNGQVNVEKPDISNDTLLINELIREYLTWNGYKYAKSVFIQESGLSGEPLSRNQLLKDLGVSDTEESSKFSILYGIIAAFKEDVKKEI